MLSIKVVQKRRQIIEHSGVHNIDVFYIPIQYLYSPQCFPIKQRQKSFANLDDLRQFLKLSNSKKPPWRLHAAYSSCQAGIETCSRFFLLYWTANSVLLLSFSLLFPRVPPAHLERCPASPASKSHLIYWYLKSSDGFMCFEWIGNKKGLVRNLHEKHLQ